MQFASAPFALPTSNAGPQFLVRLDHNRSEEHRLAFRYIHDTRTDSPRTVYFPGFITDQAVLNHNFLFTDQYTFSPTWTNEFRFAYSLQNADDPRRISTQSIPEAQTQPRISIAGDSINSPGIASHFIQFRHVNNLLFQEKQTKLSATRSATAWSS